MIQTYIKNSKNIVIFIICFMLCEMSVHKEHCFLTCESCFSSIQELFVPITCERNPINVTKSLILINMVHNIVYYYNTQ